MIASTTYLLGYKLISIIFASRVKDNPDSNINEFINSLISLSTSEELGQLELIVKYDDDDDVRQELTIGHIPFPVKQVVYSRCTGRSMLHHFCEYLFTLRDKRSRFILQAADDFVFTRPGWITEILEQKKDYLFIGAGQCDKELNVWNTKPRPPIEKINYNHMESWRCIFGNMAPVFSVKLIEVAQNFGWTASIDAWAYLLAMICYQDFGINIFHYTDAFFKRTEGENVVRPAQQHDDVFLKGFDHSYNLMQQTGSKNCANIYWFDLVRQQAKNIYLNIKEDGLLAQYQIC